MDGFNAGAVKASLMDVMTCRYLGDVADVRAKCEAVEGQVNPFCAPGHSFRLYAKVGGEACYDGDPFYGPFEAVLEYDGTVPGGGIAGGADFQLYSEDGVDYLVAQIAQIVR